MPKGPFAYHSGSTPETPEAQARVVEAWGRWFGSAGAALSHRVNAAGEGGEVCETLDAM